jgi:hypothetical protein
MKKMKHYICVPIILLATNFCAVAQSTETIRVSAGEDIAGAISPDGIFRFPAFAIGSIFLKDGKQGKELLNYNILSDQIVYIDKKGDTLAIGIPDQIKKITLNETNFYYDKTDCVEEIASARGISLVKKCKISIDYQKKGAFGISSYSTGGVDVYDRLPSISAYHLLVNGDAIIKKKVAYFLLTGEGRQLAATRSNFINLFEKNKENVEHYLSSNKVNYNKEQDLAQLFGIAASSN